MSDCEHLKENFRGLLEKKIEKDYLSESLAKYFREFCLCKTKENQENSRMYNLAEGDSDNDLFEEPKKDDGNIEF